MRTATPNVLVRRALKTSVARFPRGVRVNNAYRALKTSTRAASTVSLLGWARV